MLATVMLATVMLGTGCSQGRQGTAAKSAVEEIRYWLWDPNQLPVYQQCAEDFHRAHPTITVKVERYAWEQYWDKVSSLMLTGSAPDVFADHLNYFPSFAAKGQIMPLDDLIAKDGVKTDIYAPGLADLWVYRDGKRYGLPKDFDTVAIFFNKKMLADAGISSDQLNTATWNPTDGGSYEKLVAHLTLDDHGRRGDQPGFDKTHVKVYGLGLEEGDGISVGQQYWSMYALSTGWRYTDKNPWGTRYQFDDPRFQQTMAWYRGLIAKGYMPSLAVARSGVTIADAFRAGKYALSTNGSWMIGAYFGDKPDEVGLAPTPVGPTGKRATIFNGLADSIYVGSAHKQAAWQWVKYLASIDCQKTVGDSAVVFPAIPEALKVAQEHYDAKGIDVKAFTQPIDEGATHLYPITEHASEVDALMSQAMDQVLTLKADPSIFTAVNNHINALFR